MNNTVIVFSIGKSGSSTTMAALRSAGVSAHRGYPGNVVTLPYEELPIVFLVREPIARAISETFEDARLSRIPDTILSIAKDNANTLLPSWFNFFGCPFEKLRFNRKSGMAIKKSQFGNEILFIRTDKLDNLHFGLAALLDVPDTKFTVEHRAKGTKRFEGYEEFLAEAKFSPDALSDIYDSDFCKHFWYVKELKQLKEKWSE